MDNESCCQIQNSNNTCIYPEYPLYLGNEKNTLYTPIDQICERMESFVLPLEFNGNTDRCIIQSAILQLGTLGRTVVCTIHQPSIDIFDAFDELFILKRGGEEIYAGPLEHHYAHLIKYFEGIDGVSKIKDGYNPATWMLEVTSAAQKAALGINFTDAYKNSELYR
ncbi:unnamed protein product, partial [Vitis vinifera]|uniref:ABC transporter family G domain-containing protein n=1 Tax=Vitis vinifera TaxID=29760 RepID=D7TUX9_VITVI